jgi:hypothetical protein
VLSQAHLDHFVEHGFVVLRSALPADIVDDWLQWCYQRLECTPTTAVAKLQALTRLPGLLSVDGVELCPKGWQAIGQLMGGLDRVAGEWNFSDSFHVNSHMSFGGTWCFPSIESGEWHIDGDLTRRFFDSPEWALVALLMWTDSPKYGGTTLIAEGSVRLVSQYLLDHPEGVDAFNWGTLLKGTKTVFRQIQALPGDLLFMHPYLIHSSSANHSGIPRIHTGRAFDLKTPLNLDRPSGHIYSPIERGILRSLGLGRVQFSRQGFTSERPPLRLERMSQEAQEELVKLRYRFRNSEIKLPKELSDSSAGDDTRSLQ